MTHWKNRRRPRRPAFLHPAFLAGFGFMLGWRN